MWCGLIRQAMGRGQSREPRLRGVTNRGRSTAISRRSWIAAAVVLAVQLLTGSAKARSTHDSPYTYEQTFGSALRLIKVDLDLDVIEKDPQWGYFLFEYSSAESGNRKVKGSFQFVRVKDMVQVAVQLPAMPTYHERYLIEKLCRKLEEEHGAPPQVSRQKKKKDKDSGDKDRDSEGSKDRGPEGEKPKDKDSKNKE